MGVYGKNFSIDDAHCYGIAPSYCWVYVIAKRFYNTIGKRMCSRERFLLAVPVVPSEQMEQREGTELANDYLELDSYRLSYYIAMS